MKAQILAVACAILVAGAYGQPAQAPGTQPTTPSPPVAPPTNQPTIVPPQSAPPTNQPTIVPPQAAPPTSGSPPPATPPSASPPTGASPPPRASPPGTTPPPPAPAAATPPAPQVVPVTTASSTSPAVTGSGPAGAPTDADILYFAYNLEVFEAQFYTCAATGSPLPSNLLGGGPSPNGCQKAQLTSNVGTYFAELAREETAHVALLQKALQSVGVNPVAPAVDISGAFEKAAEAAFNTTTPLSPLFDPYANDYFAIHAAFLFEDLGASAYIGALNSISNSSYRTTAAQIGAAEAYHASLIRTLLYQTIDVTPAYNLTVRNITDAIVNVENRISGAPQLKYQIYNVNGAAISNVDSNGLVPAATAQQTLRVVTLGAPAGSGGGFFPSNLNGAVKN